MFACFGEHHIDIATLKILRRIVQVITQPVFVVTKFQKVEILYIILKTSLTGRRNQLISWSKWPADFRDYADLAQNVLILHRPWRLLRFAHPPGKLSTVYTLHSPQRPCVVPDGYNGLLFFLDAVHG